jgi:hypothetical protein
VPSAAAADAAAPARARGRRSSTNTSSTAPTASSAPAAAASGVEAAAAPALSRAKLLAQQLAKREIHTHGIAAAAAAGAAAAFTEPATGAAAPGSAWVGADELLYAGSQAQDDALLLGGDNSMQVCQATGQDILCASQCCCWETPWTWCGYQKLHSCLRCVLGRGTGRCSLRWPFVREPHAAPAFLQQWRFLCLCERLASSADTSSRGCCYPACITANPLHRYRPGPAH